MVFALKAIAAIGIRCNINGCAGEVRYSIDGGPIDLPELCPHCHRSQIDVLDPDPPAPTAEQDLINAIRAFRARHYQHEKVDVFFEVQK